MPLLDPLTYVQPVLRTLLSDLPSVPSPNRLLYLDPGSGSYLLQLLLAGLVGSAFIVRTFWSRIKAFFMRNPEQSEADEADDED